MHSAPKQWALLEYCVLVGLVLVCGGGFVGVRTQDDSLAGGFFSSLLDTITSTSDAKDCPGVCVHALATLICFDILDNITCPTSTMKCCIDTPDQAESFSNTTLPPTLSTNSTTIEITTISTTTPTTTTLMLQKDGGPTEGSVYNESSKGCFGVCVAEKIADYCEAILTTEELCKEGQRCCVSANSFGGKLPPNLIIPTKIRDNYTKPFSTTTPIAPTPTSLPPFRQPPPAGPHIPPQSTAILKPCRGECVSGLLALFCDDIDAEADCPSDGNCCITVSSNSEGESIIPTTSTPLPPSTKNPAPICPGYCLMKVMAAFCERPSVLIPHTSNCNRGLVCCDNTKPVTPITKKPRPKPHPTAAPTVRTTTTPDPRPECPGSCIVPYLSFTCFRNAEMTDIFNCPKSGTKCCAPKSLIKEALNQKEDSQTTTVQPTNSIHPSTLLTTEAATTQLTTVSRSPVYSKYVCGVKGTGRSGRVVGGRDGEQGEWCWQVALINSLNQYLCGAALIGTQWVLTAAHCVTNIVRSGDAIYVRVGDHDLTMKYGSPGAQTLRVATTYIHHNHNSQTLDNDIALLKLHGQAELKEGVCLVCLPARGVVHTAGKRCTVTGYGYMGEAGPILLKVREAEIPIVSDAECIRKVNAVTEKIFILPASSFCAGGEEGNDACQGDGGGPLVCQDDGFYELAGLVSWGFVCGHVDVPGVYVKVSSFIGWINQIISVNNM